MFCKDNQVIFRTLFLMLLMVGLMSCDSIKEKTGLTKQSPDEFTVITKAPLIMPPKFSLRPPRPGAKQLKVIQPGERARKALFAGASRNRNTADKAKTMGRNALIGAALPKNTAQVKGSELKLLEKAGVDGANSSIRQIVNKETSILAEKNSSIADRLIFWQEKQPDGTIVDAGKESKRLREAAAAGEPVNKTKVPVIKRRKKAIFEGLLNR